MFNTKNRIFKKSLKLIENDLDRMLRNQSERKSKVNSIFSDFDKNFCEKLENNKKYIKGISKSIHNTKK